MSATALGLWILGGLLVVALGFVAAGAACVVKPLQRLKKRAEAYGRLPIAVEIERAQLRIADIERDVAELAPLLERARVAIVEIVAARQRVQRQVAALGAAARFVNSMLFPRPQNGSR